MGTLEGMRIFTRVVQSGSLSAAGRVLGMSPASVSRKISVLEQSIGAQLLNRTSRKLALTNIGQLYFEKACSILDQVADVADAISAHEGSARGQINVHIGLGLFERFLKHALPEFLTGHPDILVRLYISDDCVDLMENKIDVSIRRGAPDQASLIIRKLSQKLEQMICVSPGYLRGHPDIMSPLDLPRHNCLPVSGSHSVERGYIWSYQHGNEIKELRVKGNLTANNEAVVQAAALAGVGVALLPAWAAAEHLQNGDLVRILAEYRFSANAFDDDIFAVFTKTLAAAPRIRAFVDFLVEAFRNTTLEAECVAPPVEPTPIEHLMRAGAQLRYGTCS